MIALKARGRRGDRWPVARRVGMAVAYDASGDTPTATSFIQRLNTSGGLAPSAGCRSKADVGNQAFVPYTANYFFYTKAS